MTPSPPRRRAVLAGTVALLALSGCGAKNSYDAVEAGLRDWLTAVHAGDPIACELEATRFGMHEDLLEEHPELGGPGTSCADRVSRMGALDLPAPDSPMSVPAWDPSGEAYVEVADDAGGHQQYWMFYQDGRWLVGGELR